MSPPSAPATGRRAAVRPLEAGTVVLAVAAFLVAADNAAFWRTLLDVLAGNVYGSAAFLLSTLACVVLVLNALLSLLAIPFVLKPTAATLLVASAAAAHFMDAYGVLIDRAMIANVLQTDAAEAAELITPALLGRVALLGVLPAALVARARIRYRTGLRGAGARVGVAALSVGLAVAVVAPFSKDYAIIAREHRELRHLMTPFNFVAALVSQARRASAGRSARRIEPVGTDARLGTGWARRARPALLVLVVGETARAESFSLNGYARETNPRLARADVLDFTDVESCGTSTAESLPCMFSDVGVDRRDAASARENLLDVLARAGFEVLWRENNSGCKGVCTRVRAESTRTSASSRWCTDGGCYDEALLDGLQERIGAARGNLAIVLHQQGSHGPAYHRRYPPQFGVFEPACASNDVRGCSRAELVNAYDNTILYTDHFLARVIDLLRDNDAAFDTAMIYVSDHGESLGEGGLYLHGAPRLIAPAQQTHVPLIVWLSPRFETDFGLDHDCLAAERGARLSHDHLFSSVLGLLDVATTAYDRRHDIFGTCVRGARRMHRAAAPAATS